MFLVVTIVFTSAVLLMSTARCNQAGGECDVSSSVFCCDFICDFMFDLSSGSCVGSSRGSCCFYGGVMFVSTITHRLRLSRS